MGERGSDRRRVALYSHDTQGLGHVRRNSLIAASLVAADAATEVLLLSGAPEATALPMPPRTSVVTVPALGKTIAGDYHPRSLPLSMKTVLAMRAAILEESLADFDPDLLVVDKVPLGVFGELRRALTSVRQRGTRTVLGLREVLDEPEVAVREWHETASSEVVRRLYDAVWVYGEPTVYDPAVEYRWPAHVRRKVTYTGYLARGRSDLLAAGTAMAPAAPSIEQPFVLCLVGGGQDGEALCDAFAEAPLPPGHRGVLVTGPYLAPAARQRMSARAAGREDLELLGFVADVPSLVARAAATVAMGGYNTVCEVLEHGQPVLLSPRTVPRREQAVRAERLREAGLVDVVPADGPSPEHLGSWLAEAVQRGRRHAHVDLDGLARLPRLAARLMDAGREVDDDVAV